MTTETWFERLTAALLTGGATPETVPDVNDDERDALLDLARVAAHTSERWAAPISTFVVGAALHGLPAGERAAAVRRLVAMLDPSA